MMAPARNLRRCHFDSYGACFADTNMDQFSQEKASLVTSLMAEEGEEEEEEEEVGTSSKEEDKAWLQLGIGGSSNSDSSSHRIGGPSTELRLFPDIRPIIPWGSLRLPPSASMARSYSFGQFGYTSAGGSSSSVGSAVELRVVSPPHRPQTGLWFELKAAGNQGKEPFLPQIPKSYLRIRDGGMTVRLLMKYLANKLGLEDESEVEITCRGQQLHPLLTLQHIRDNIWCPTTMTAAATITDPVMILQYGRRA